MDIGIYEIKKENEKYVVYDNLNATEHIFDLPEEAGQFIKEEIIYCSKY